MKPTDSLPTEPLAPKQAEVISKSDNFERCIPMYKLKDSQNNKNIIAMMMKKGGSIEGTTTIAMFNPLEERWEIKELSLLELVEDTASGDDHSALDSDMFEKAFEQFKTWYDESEYISVKQEDIGESFTPETMFEGVEAGLPDRPLESDELDKIVSALKIDSIVPCAKLSESGGIVTIFTSAPYPPKRQSYGAVMCYNKGENQWKTVGCNDLDAFDDPEYQNQLFERGAFEHLADHYDPEMIEPVPAEEQLQEVN
jgi:hypothetical protein